MRGEGRKSGYFRGVLGSGFPGTAADEVTLVGASGQALGTCSLELQAWMLLGRESRCGAVVPAASSRGPGGPSLPSWGHPVPLNLCAGPGGNPIPQVRKAEQRTPSEEGRGYQIGAFFCWLSKEWEVGSL